MDRKHPWAAGSPNPSLRHSSKTRGSGFSQPAASSPRTGRGFVLISLLHNSIATVLQAHTGLP